jgi:phosphoglucosamine mutase
MSEFATTGDGLLTGLHLLAEVARTGTPLADLAAKVTIYPQVLVNVTGVDRHRVESDEGVTQAVEAASRELGDTGRVLLRPSGTEPVVRVMVEAETQAVADDVAARLVDVVRERLSLETAAL